MGHVVLASPPSPSAELRLYAHCLAGAKGGVGLLAINTGSNTQTLDLRGKGEVWTMTAEPLDSKIVSINGKTPEVDAEGKLNGLEGLPLNAATAIPAQSISFVALHSAANPACRSE